ncbi:MAG: 3-phosphoshikimate 1-carboxyvinyltransferase [Gemmatimonadaceae bacterium]
MAALKTTRVSGVIRAPGDKSISHRALILAALARGKSHISNILQSADVHSSAGVLRALGAGIPPLSNEFVITGAGSRLRSPAEPLDCGNSGTTTRLMAGVVAGSALTSTFVGDASLSRRPMRRIAEPLTAMGAKVELADHGGLPMIVSGAALRPITWESRVASAQVKSAIFLAALTAGVPATVREPHPSRDHTERMLRGRGVAIETSESGTTIEIEGGQVLRPEDVSVPADPSSAAFWVALAALSGGGDVELTDVCLNPTRTGFLDVMRRMGARIALRDQREEGGELLGTIAVAASTLRALDIAAEHVPAMIDELPLFACVAARAEGTTVVRGAGELRVKESDRIATLVSNLRILGADAEELDDGFRITGSDRPLRGRITTNGDHRIAMAFGVLGALAPNAIEIDDQECVAVSYPDFWRELERVTA